MNLYDPAATDGLDFWERLSYGDTPTRDEEIERTMVVHTLLNCHTELMCISAALPPSTQDRFPGLLVNEACGGILDTVAKILHIDREEAQMSLLDLNYADRDRMIKKYVQQAREVAFHDR